jgi:arginase
MSETFLIGIPSDRNSSFLRGPALAPARIREALFGESSNLYTEGGADLSVNGRLVDKGDLPSDSRTAVTETVAEILASGKRVLSLGGDHSITYPIVQAYADRFGPLSILHLDAHPDLYDQYDGNRFSHACPFARIMEAGLAARLVQVGIRAITSEQQAQINRFGVEVVQMKDWFPGRLPLLETPIYLSLDLDVLDPAFAPGVSHHEPGGFSTRDLITLVNSITAPIIGADIVEYNPLRDPVGITAMAAAKLVKEIAAKMSPDAGAAG